jgi:hypothetical protein
MIESVGPPLDDYTIAEMAIQEYSKLTASYRDEALILAVFPAPQLCPSVSSG